MTVSVHQAAATLSARALARAEAVGDGAARLRSHLATAAELLRHTYGVREVLLFGSLAAQAPTRAADVDLAVMGLAPRCYFDALADLLGIFGAPVDLVALETAPESLRERVRAEGIPL